MADSVESTIEPTDDEPESAPLFGFWYRAALSDRLRRGRVTRTVLLETQVVLGRDRDGRPFAMRDACPHRGTPLSRGWFDGERIQCPYHGWTFDVRTGQCRSIPSCASGQNLDVGRIYAGHLACEERDGFVWVYLPEPARSPLGRMTVAPDPAPAVPVLSDRYRSFSLSGHVPIAADHALTSLLDPAHGPFVHARWWWFARILLSYKRKRGDAAGDSNIEREFVPIPFGFRETTVLPVTSPWFRRHAGADVSHVAADFVLPYNRVGQIRTGRFWIAGIATVTPITKDSSRIDVRLSWYLFYWWPFAALTLKFFFWIFFLQDKRVMTWQAQGLAGSPPLISVDDADRPLRWYYRVKRAYLRAKRTGAAFEHPLREPVTLRWRNAHVGDIIR